MKKAIVLVAAVTIAATVVLPSTAIAGGGKVQAHRPSETGFVDGGQHADSDPIVSHRQFQSAR